jgi:hypothetical protein
MIRFADVASLVTMPDGGWVDYTSRRDPSEPVREMRIFTSAGAICVHWHFDHWWARAWDINVRICREQDEIEAVQLRRHGDRVGTA